MYIYTGNIKILGGGKNGRVRVYNKHMQKWGTICSPRLRLLEGHVICRQLGFKKAKKTFHFKGRGVTALKNVKCTGDEQQISHCKSSLGGCNKHKRDVGVRCI